jgi:hypothetical protein
MNTNQQSNSLSGAVVSLQLSLSRLEAIANLLNLPQTEAINTLVDWAETGVLMARHLNIDHPTPEALSDRVKELEQNYASLSSNSKSLPSETTTHTQPGSMSNDEQKRLLISVASLSNSVEFLTRALVEGKTYSTDNRERDSSEVMIQDISNAIDAIIMFNDESERPHKQKFRINIETLYVLTKRARNSISKVLKQRSEEIELHHQRHQLDTYHNKNRRDEQGKLYPPIKSEPEIDYQKHTEIAA